MSKTTFTTTSGYLTIKTGSEGPHHDPYGYIEFTFTRKRIQRKGKTVVLHLGLAEWIQINDRKLDAPRRLRMSNSHNARAIGKARMKWFNDRFAKETGYSRVQWERFCRKARERCRCGCKQFETQSGYPGESFEVCTNCGAIVSCDFNESAII
jgi:hypothetical protein